MTDRLDARPLEDVIVSLGRPVDPQLSPDGRYVAYSEVYYGKEGEHATGAVWVARVDGEELARKYTSGSALDTHPRWSPDGRWLGFLSDREEPGTKSLFRISVDGGEAEPLHVRKSTIETFAWSTDGKRIAFLAPDEPADEDKRREEERDDADVYGERWKYARLRVLDLATGAVATLESGDRHVYDMAWSEDGQRIAFVASPTPELESSGQSELFEISLESNHPRLVGRPCGWRVSQLDWLPGEDVVVYIGSHEHLPISSSAVVRTDLLTGESRVVAPEVDEPACATAVRVIPGHDRMIVAIAEGLTTRLEWLDPRSGSRKPIYQPENGDLLPAFSIAPNDHARPPIAVIETSGSRPLEVYAGKADNLSRRSDHHAVLREYSLGEQEAFFWTSRDGMELDGVLIRPPEAGDAPLPTVVLVHGGPYGRYPMSFHLAPLNWGQWLAHHGYAVLMPNYRGGMGHGNAFAAKARGDMGGDEFRDIMTAVDVAVDRGIADPDRLGIGGWSQGGFLTAWTVTQTNRFKAGIMGAGISDWGMMSMTSDIPEFEGMLAGDRPWDGPGPHSAAERSPISYAHRVETPLLILHGKEDQRVPVSQATGFERALREYGADVQLVTYPREGHGIAEHNHQRDVLRRVRDWFQRWV